MTNDVLVIPAGSPMWGCLACEAAWPQLSTEPLSACPLCNGPLERCGAPFAIRMGTKEALAKDDGSAPPASTAGPIWWRGYWTKPTR